MLTPVPGPPATFLGRMGRGSFRFGCAPAQRSRDTLQIPLLPLPLNSHCLVFLKELAQIRKEEKEKRRRRLENVNTLRGMGYSTQAAKQALHQARGNLDDALKVMLPAGSVSSWVPHQPGSCDCFTAFLCKSLLRLWIGAGAVRSAVPQQSQSDSPRHLAWGFSDWPFQLEEIGVSV